MEQACDSHQPGRVQLRILWGEVDDLLIVYMGLLGFKDVDEFLHVVDSDLFAS